MKLYTQCTSCKKDISFWTWSQTRIELQKTKGKLLLLTCKKCGHSNKYDLNDIEAKPSRFALVISLIIFVFGTLFLLIMFSDYIWEVGIYGVVTISSIVLIPSIVFTIINKNDRQRVNTFNQN